MSLNITNKRKIIHHCTSSSSETSETSESSESSRPSDLSGLSSKPLVKRHKPSSASIYPSPETSSPSSPNLARIINPLNLNLSYLPSNHSNLKHLKSCSRCRKHKTKCNYIDVAPYSCSSCAKRGLVCELEVVVPVKRSNIIKNLSNDIENLKKLVNDLIEKDLYLKSLCREKGIKVPGLINNIDSCSRDYSCTMGTTISQNTNQNNHNGHCHENRCGFGNVQQDIGREEEEEQEEEEEADDDEEVDGDDDDDDDDEEEEEEEEEEEGNARESDKKSEKTKMRDNSHINVENYNSQQLRKIKTKKTQLIPTNETITNNLMNDTIITSLMNETITTSLMNETNTTSLMNETNPTSLMNYPKNNTPLQLQSSHKFTLNKCKQSIGNIITPELTDAELDEKLFDNPNIKLYSLNDICCFSYLEINQFIDNFNANYLPFLPILSEIKDIDHLFNTNKLLFWTIVFIITGNIDIYNRYIIKEILSFTDLSTTPTTAISSSVGKDTLDSVTPILLLCCFITKMNSTKYDIKDELDTSIFQWLKVCKDSLQKNQLVNEKSSQYEKNVWSSIFILGNFYSFRLGLKWSQQIDLVLEDQKEQSNYIGQMLNVTILFSKLMDTFLFNNDPHSVNSNDLLLLKSLSNWKFKLNTMKSNLSSLSGSSLAPSLYSTILSSFNFLSLIFILFEPQNENLLNHQITDIIRISNDFYDSIKYLDLFKCPIHLKISLECFCLVLSKLCYSPLFLSNSSIDPLDITPVYTNLFNRLISFVEFNDTKFIFNLLMDFDSNVKVDFFLIDVFDMSSFKSKLLPGLISDFKKFNQKFRSIDSNSNRLSETISKFNSYNLNFDRYNENFSIFRNKVDLVILYSNEILKLPSAENDVKNPSISSIDSSSSSLGSSPSLFENNGFINPSVHLQSPQSIKKDIQVQLSSQSDDMDLLQSLSWN